MVKKWIAFAFGILMIFTLAACQAAPAASSGGNGMNQPRTIMVNGTGKVFLTPDVAYINIGVQSQDENVGNALSKNNEKAQAIAAKLQELGVDAKDIQTTSFNIYPSQQYNPEGQPTTILYTVDNTVNVTVRDLTQLGKLLDEVVRTGANSINGINFDVLDRSKAITEARKLAVQDARAQADELAAAAGVEIDTVSTMSVYIDTGPAPLYDAKGGMATGVSQVPVSAGQLAISVNVSASYTLK
jgi:uncharacterized protein YggE